MGQHDNLKWKTVGDEVILHTPIMDVHRQHKIAANGLERDYLALSGGDWVVVLAVRNGNLILVRQWRHGEECLTLELPGGGINRGEDVESAAYRELEEETGYRAGRMTFLGKVSSNPAIMQNHFSIYLAEDLEATGELHPDDDEFIEVEEVPIAEVIRRFGDNEMTHAFMGTALAMYFRYCMDNGLDIMTCK